MYIFVVSVRKIETNPSDPRYVHTKWELVTISRHSFKDKWKFLRSLRFRITLILVIVGIVPSIIIENGIVQSEDRAVNLRTVTVKNQCDILCNQLVRIGYMDDPSNEVIDGEFNLLTNIYGEEEY